MTVERPKVGIGVAIRRDGRLLMGQRLCPHATGTWCCPGGHLEHGESFADCARREVAEECGLTITMPWLGFVTNDVFPDGKHYITLCMVADWVSGEAQVLEPDKMTGWAWFAWEALPGNLMLPFRNILAAGYNPFLSIPPQAAEAA